MGSQHEEKIERYAPHLPAFSAVVLVLMGFGFITGLYLAESLICV